MVKKLHGMKARLARELGISGAAVAKLAARGMPIDDADAARRWRAANLHPGRVRPDPGPSPETLVQRAQSLVGLAIAARASHRFDLVADELRQAMRAIPETHRVELVLPRDLWAALIGAHAMAVLDDGPKEAPGTLSAEDAYFVGQVCYSLACGEMMAT